MILNASGGGRPNARGRPHAGRCSRLDDQRLIRNHQVGKNLSDVNTDSSTRRRFATTKFSCNFIRNAGNPNRAVASCTRDVSTWQELCNLDGTYNDLCSMDNGSLRVRSLGKFDVGR